MSGVSPADGAVIHQWTDVNGLNQQFKVEATNSGYYKLTAQHSGKVVDVRASNTSDGAIVQQYASNGTNAQQWKFVAVENGYYKLESRLSSNKVLDVSGSSTTDGARVQLWTDNSSCAQKWKFEQIGGGSGADTPINNPNGWNQVLSDNFDGTTVDTNKWDTRWHEQYTDGKARFLAWYPQQYNEGVSNVSVANGIATIIAKKESWYKGASWARGGLGYDYSSGVLQNGFKQGFTYGYFEARFKGPAANARGTDADFFLFARDYSWPPEIDIAELPGTSAARSILTNVHWYDSSRPNNDASSWQYINVNTDAWHTYAVLWQPNLLIWYVDNREVRRVTAHVPNKEMFINLAIEVNGGAGDNFYGDPAAGVWPQTMQIDHVRVWQKR